MISRCALLLLVTAAAVVSQQQTSGSVDIQVLNNLTGDPLPGANVVITSEQGNESRKTDARGIFTGHCRLAASCLVTVTRRGFAMPKGSGMGIFLDAGKLSNNAVTVRMHPHTVIAGRVLDQYGDPVRHALVHVEDKYSRAEMGTFY